MAEFDSVAAAQELRDSVPADQPRLRRLMDIIVRSFERDRERGVSGEDVPVSVQLAADTGHDIDFEPERLGLTGRTPEL